MRHCSVPKPKAHESGSTPWFTASLACLALVAVGIHLDRTLSLFGGWKGVVNRQPLVAVDHALHLYHGHLGAQSIRAAGRVCGYDPAFYAGYPRTPLFDPSATLAELSQLPFEEPSPTAYKVVVFAVTLAVPLFVAAAAGSLWRSGRCALLAGSACVLYWWVGYPNGLLRSGLVAFLWSAALSTCFAVALARHPGRWASWRTIPLVLLAALGVQAHPTFPIQGVMVAGLWICTRAQRRFRWWVAASLLATSVLTVTWPWWWPLLCHWQLRQHETPFLYAASPWFVVDYFAGDWGYRADAYVPTMVALFLPAAALASRGRGPGLVWSHLVYLAALCFAGSFWEPTRSLEPVRFQVPMVLTGIVLASGVVASSLSRRPLVFRTLCAAALAVSAFLAYRATLPAAWVRLRMDRPIPQGLRPEAVELVRFLRRETTTEHRILLEGQLRLWENTDEESIHWTPLLPWLTGRSFIGGLYSLAPLPHRQITFADGALGDRPVAAWSDEELRAFLIRYNVGWIITWSRRRAPSGPVQATERFADLPGVELVAVLPRISTRPLENRYTVYRFRDAQGWALRGKIGQLRAGYNSLELTDVIPEYGVVVLSMHYFPGWRADADGVEVIPVPLSQGRLPFLGLRLDRPIARLRLRFTPAGHRPWRRPWPSMAVGDRER